MNKKTSPTNVIPLFKDERGELTDDDGPLHTELFASPAGLFIQQETMAGDKENPDCVALTWEQTAMLLTNLIALIHTKMNEDPTDPGGFIDGAIH